MQIDGIAVIATIAGVIAACVRGVTYVSTNIVNPVKMTVTQLQDVTRDLRKWMDDLRMESRAQDKRLTIVEETMKMEGDRIDALRDRIDALEEELKKHEG